MHVVRHENFHSHTAL